ncbi:MAG: AAA family ATPase [Treponema sp.]
MQQRYMPVNIKDFPSIIKENYVYVDKTHFLWNMNRFNKTFFLPRLRRFQKSLYLSTLKAYYDIDQVLPLTKTLMANIPYASLDEDKLFLREHKYHWITKIMHYQMSNLYIS